MTLPVLTTLALTAARRFADRVALTIPGMGSFSFREIDRRAGCFAGGLLQLGVRPGDRVVLYLPNGWEWIVAYHAIARAAAVVVPTNIMLSDEELRFIVADCEASLVILPAERLHALALPAETSCVALGAFDRLGFSALLEHAYCKPLERAPDDLFTIGYTSGTTGKPKGAMLAHKAIHASIAATATMHVRHEGDTVLSSLPFPHVYGNIVMNAMLLAGTRLIAPPRFHAGETLELIQSERVTLFEGVPTMYYRLLGEPALAKTDLSSLTRCTVGGQTMPTAKIEAVAKRFGCPMLELWGMTEVGGPAISHSPYWPSRYGAIGLAMPGTETRIGALEDPAREVPPGAPGELFVRGLSVMDGYWRKPAATKEALDDAGWLATGDVALRDKDGYLFIVDRKKDLIITAGFNIYPAELEQVIALHPDVAMVAVTGLPDEEKGELAAAFVVRCRESTLTEAALLAHCRERLAAYKVPRRVSFVDDLPKTATGKVMRRALRQIATQQTQSERGGDAT